MHLASKKYCSNNSQKNLMIHDFMSRRSHTLWIKKFLSVVFDTNNNSAPAEVLSQ